MAFPTIEKTWQFNQNIMISSADEGINIKTVVLAIKNALISFESNPWIVTGSSNKIEAGMDGTDRWNTVADLQYGAAGSAPHSWIVLKQTAIHSNFEICIEFGASGTTRYIGFIVGISGFTGGSVTNRPTATTQIIINNNTLTWYPYQNQSENVVLQIMQSTDGECTRIIYLNQQVPGLFWLFDKPKNPVSGWTNPFIVIFKGNYSLASQLTIAQYSDSAAIVLYANSTSATAYMAIEGYGTGTIIENMSIINQINGEHNIFPISIVSETTGTKGRLGQIYDLWFGNVSAASLGTNYTSTTYPSNSTRQLWQCDDIVFPWSGTPSVAGPKISVGF